MLKLRLKNLLKASFSLQTKCPKRLFFQGYSQFSDQKPPQKMKGFEKFERTRKETIKTPKEEQEVKLKNEKEEDIKMDEKETRNESSFFFFSKKKNLNSAEETKTKETTKNEESKTEEIKTEEPDTKPGFGRFKRTKPQLKNVEASNEQKIAPSEEKKTPEEKEQQPTTEKQEEKPQMGKKEEVKKEETIEGKTEKEHKKPTTDKHKKLPPRPKKPSFFQFKINIDKKNNKDNKEEEPKKPTTEPKEDEPEGASKLKMRHFMFAALVGSLFMSFVSDVFSDKNTITYFDFVKNYVDEKKVKAIMIKRAHKFNKLQTVATIAMNDQSNKKLIIHNLDYFLSDLEKHQSEMGMMKETFIPIEFIYEPQKSETRLIKIALLGVSLYIMYVVFKSTRNMGKFYQGGASSDLFGMGSSNVKIFGIDTNVKVRFKDVAGLNEAKVEISEFVDFLKQPTKYNEIGAKLPRGALLTGPPGTGKTMLAKACAGEAGVPFFYISGSDFVEMFVGVGASRVRDLFRQAKSKAPSIIFIDEVDAVGRKRESKMGRSNDERDNTLNQLLVEMDGFGTNSQVVVLAATNRKELLDPALTRPGRFDRQIEVSLPDIEGRFCIFLVHLTPLKLNPEKTKDEYAKRLATLTPGFSGADIANLCNESAILASRQNKKHVDSIDFEMAAERIIAGLEKKKFISDEERKTIATHEAGHAVISWFLEGGNPLLKLTIIPRSKGSLGFAQYLPNESTLQTREELIDQICCILGGRCSEEHFFGKITTGAYDDLDKAYKLANAMVTKFGMSQEIGFMGFSEDEYKKSYSDYTQDLIDKEISLIIAQCSERTRELISQYKDQIEKLRNVLLEKETLDLNNIIDILGERPFAAKSNFKAYLKSKREMSEEAAASTPV